MATFSAPFLLGKIEALLLATESATLCSRDFSKYTRPKSILMEQIEIKNDTLSTISTSAWPFTFFRIIYISGKKRRLKHPWILLGFSWQLAVSRKKLPNHNRVVKSDVFAGKNATHIKLHTSDSAVVGVLNSVEGLRWAIRAKTEGKIAKIIAGPNIAMPKEHGGIIFNEHIDVFLAPSGWAKDWLASLAPARAGALRIWAAGVETAPITKLSAGREAIIVYKKRCPTALFERIIAELQKRKLPYKVITYGTYNRRAYLRALNMAKGLIFLSESESQGIAIHEAWMMDVPTLVWDRRLFKAGDYEWMGASSAPYLSDEVGVEFKDEQELSTKLDSFLQKLDTFRPRAYHLKNFTDQKAAQEYLKFI
jgi:hypothetical protein